jgi:hypothetical protein
MIGNWAQGSKTGPRGGNDRSVSHEGKLISMRMEYAVEQSPQMETIQIVLDKRLLLTADEAARRMNRNRSALMRDALREHLQRLALRDREARDRAGYVRQPAASHESVSWEKETAWPAE